MKLNNKGFAISSILYIVLVLAVILIILSLTMLSSRSLIIDKIKKEVMEDIYSISYEDVIKTLKEEAINYGINNGITKESVKIGDFESSISSYAKDYHDLTSKYLTIVNNNGSYDIYLGKVKKINDISKSLDMIDIINYKLYGNSYQESSPSTNSPQEIKSFGNLISDSGDANNGKYKIKIKTSKSNENKETIIILDAPLRSIDKYYDYINYGDKKIVRSVNEYAITGREGDSQSSIWKYSGGHGKEIRSNILTSKNLPMNLLVRCNYYPYMDNTNSLLNHIRIISDLKSYGYIAINDLNYQGEDTVDSFVLYLQGLYDNGVPVKVLYTVYPNKNTTSLELPKIDTFIGKQKISIDTDIKPSDIEFTIIQKIKQL